MKALKRFFSTMHVVRMHVQSGPKLVALPVSGERGDALGALLRLHHLEIGGPVLQRVIFEGGLDPEHRAPGLAHNPGEPIDVGHDIFRHRAKRVGDPWQHEGVLHVDHDERGLGRIEGVINMLPTAPRHDTIDDRLRDGQLMHHGLHSLPG
jgi:hypothetical protein